MAPGETPAHGPTPGLSVPQLRNATELLCREVVALRRATEQELDAQRPADEADANAWLSFLIWVAEQKGTTPTKAERALGRVMHEALADVPVQLTLSGGDHIAIHAKSLHALGELDVLDATLRRAGEDLAQLGVAVLAGELHFADVIETKVLATMLNMQAVQLYAWILATPGPGLPFDEQETDPQPPAWTRTLTGADLEAIVRAHLQVNREDIEFLAAAFPSDGDGVKTRLPLAGFVGSYANEIGEKPRELMCNVSLRSLFAGALAHAQALREAQAAARPEASA